MKVQNLQFIMLSYYCTIIINFCLKEVQRNNAKQIILGDFTVSYFISSSG